MQKLSFFLLSCVFITNLVAQDSSKFRSVKNKLLIGVYVTEKEFLNRKPSINKPFKIIPNMDSIFNEQINGLKLPVNRSVGY